MDYKDIKKAINIKLGEIFRVDGFSGSGTHFRKISRDQFQAVNVQYSSSGNRIYINLGISFPEILGNSIEPKKIKEIDCEIRKRLTNNLSEVDHHWDFENEEDIDRLCSDIEVTFLKNGREFFEQYKNLDRSLESIRNNLMNGIFYGFRQMGLSTEVRTMYWLAKYYYRHNDRESAKSLANKGLTLITGKSGSGLIQDLKEIVEGNFV